MQHGLIAFDAQHLAQPGEGLHRGAGLSDHDQIERAHRFGTAAQLTGYEARNARIAQGAFEDQNALARAREQHGQHGLRLATEPAFARVEQARFGLFAEPANLAHYAASTGIAERFYRADRERFVEGAQTFGRHAIDLDQIAGPFRELG